MPDPSEKPRYNAVGWQQHPLLYDKMEKKFRENYASIPIFGRGIMSALYSDDLSPVCRKSHWIKCGINPVIYEFEQNRISSVLIAIAESFVKLRKFSHGKCW